MRREVEEFAEVHDLALCQAADEEEATGVRSDVGPTREVEVMVRVELCVRDLLRDLLRDACCVRSSVHLRILNFSLNLLLSLSPPNTQRRSTSLSGIVIRSWADMKRVSAPQAAPTIELSIVNLNQDGSERVEHARGKEIQFLVFEDDEDDDRYFYYFHHALLSKFYPTTAARVSLH